MPRLADLVICGRVFRGLAAGFAEALAISDGRVMAARTADEIAGLIGPETRRIDLRGRVAIPGLNEAHMHHLPFGLGLSQVNLRAADGVRSLDEVLHRLRAAAERTPKGEWVLGRGYDHGELDVGRHPLAEEIDRAVPDHPVMIVRTCGHMSVANTAAMRLAGVGHNTPDPEGGAIERRDGKLTGLFKERARRLIADRIPPPSEAALVDAIDDAGRTLAAYGFTSGSDMNVGMTAGAAEVAAYRRARRRRGGCISACGSCWPATRRASRTRPLRSAWRRLSLLDRRRTRCSPGVPSRCLPTAWRAG